MYKTKVDIPLFAEIMVAGTIGVLENDSYKFAIMGGSSCFFNKSFVESHPEFFEKVEEKPLAEKVLDETFSYDGCDRLYLRSAVIQAMQEYHKLAGGWSDEEMIEFYHFVNTICPRESSIKNDLAAYRQKRGNQ